MVQLHGFEEMVFPGPQVAAHILTDGSKLHAFRLNGVLGIVGVVDHVIAITGQRRGSTQHLLWTSVESYLVMSQ